jgi:hypothetical protein
MRPALRGFTLCLSQRVSFDAHGESTLTVYQLAFVSLLHFSKADLDRNMDRVVPRVP